MMLLFIVLFSQLVLSQKQETNKTKADAEELFIDSPCITDIRAENLEFIGIEGMGLCEQYVKIDYECYGNLNDKNNVIQISTEAQCYIPYQYINHHFQGKEYPRCGECLEVTGPSLQKQTCTIVGSFAPIDSDWEDKLREERTEHYKKEGITDAKVLKEKVDYDIYYRNYSLTRTIILGNSMFETVAGYSDGTKGTTLPIVAQFVNCPYKIPPSAVITGENDNELNLTVIHSNMIVNRVTYTDANAKGKDAKEKEKELNYDLQTNQFTLKLDGITKDKKGKLKLYNLYDKSISINFDVTKYEEGEDYLQTGLAVFKGPINQTRCHLRTNGVIIGKEREEDRESEDPYFVWSLYRIFNVSDLSQHEKIDKENVVATFDDFVYFAGTFPYPVKFSQLYSNSRTGMDIDGLPGFPAVLTRTFIGDFSKSIHIPCTSRDLSIDVEVTQDDPLVVHYGTYSRSSIKTAKCINQLNFVQILFYHSVKYPFNSTMYMTEMVYEPYAPLNYTKCKFEDLICPDDIECDPLGENVMDDPEKPAYEGFKVGCRPYCGRCKTGYNCTKAGRCIVEPTSNMRQSAGYTFIFMILIILSFI